MFILAVRPDARQLLADRFQDGPRSWRLACNDRYCGSGLRLRVEDLDPSINFFAERPWNEPGKVAMHKWLCVEKPPQHKVRMEALGNVVVPQQAFLGMTILTRMLSGRLILQ